MANLAFSTRTYPTFGTAKRPKPEAAWKGSVYYWWWEYLRRNAAYKRCCEQNGSSKLAALYADFGDVHATDFKTWWNEGNRGGRLFAEPPASLLFDELTYDQVKALGEWNTKAMMVIQVPLNQTKRHLTKRFATLLKKRHSGKRGKRMLEDSKAHRKLAAPFKIESLKASLLAYDIRTADPKRPYWRIAIDAGLAPSVVKRLKGGVPDDEERNALTVGASRAIKRAKAMIENTAKGIFPKA